METNTTGERSIRAMAWAVVGLGIVSMLWFYGMAGLGSFGQMEMFRSLEKSGAIVVDYEKLRKSGHSVFAGATNDNWHIVSDAWSRSMQCACYAAITVGALTSALGACILLIQYRELQKAKPRPVGGFPVMLAKDEKSDVGRDGSQ